MSDFLTPMTHAHFTNIDSTNTALMHAIINGKLSHNKHHLYTADHQTSGRGQHGRCWVSGAGNVFLTLFTPIGQNHFELHQLSGLLSLAVAFELGDLAIIQKINQIRLLNNLSPVGIKWANDIGFYDESLGVFHKLAGILIEPIFKKISNKSTLVGVAVGVGLNVNTSPTIQDGLYQATCLKMLDTAINIHAKDLYTPMANAILQAVHICNRCKEPMYLQYFIDKFNAHHLLNNQNIQIFIQNNMTDVFAQGRCIGIGSQGELLLAHHDDITPIYAGMAKIIKENQ